MNCRGRRSSTSRGRAARAGADDAVRRDRRREATPPVWAGPPADFTLERARIRALRFVAAWHPELVALAQTGDLLLYERPFAYRERRSDGYCEPEAILVLGTAHVGTQSAADTTALIQAVRPDKVVVELCRSRAVALYRDVGERAERSHRPHKAAAANQGVPLAMGGASPLAVCACSLLTPVRSDLTRWQVRGSMGASQRCGRSASQAVTSARARMQVRAC